MPITVCPQVPGIQLIGIHGKAKSGKDTVGDYLQQHYANTYTESFADALKECASKAFGIPLEDFYSEKKEQVNEFWGTTPRIITQFVGTEFFRNNIYQICPDVAGNFWVQRLVGKLTGQARLIYNEGDYSEGDTVVIPDVRFQNEYDFILSNGGIVIVLSREGADGNVGIANHVSESGIKYNGTGQTFFVENNGTLEELYVRVDSIIRENSFVKLTQQSLD